MSTLPSGEYSLASAWFHLPKITASSFSFKIEITIFNKRNASTCVPQVISLCRNSLFFSALGIGALGYGREGAIVKSSRRLDGCYPGQRQCTLMPGHGGNLKTATLEWVPGGRGKVSRA